MSGGRFFNATAAAKSAAPPFELGSGIRLAGLNRDSGVTVREVKREEKIHGNTF
jgi:hypothetical protein